MNQVATLNSQIAQIRNAWNDILETDGELTLEEQRMDLAVCAAASDENSGWISPQEYKATIDSWKEEEICWNAEIRLSDQLADALKRMGDWADFFCMESKADEDAMYKALTAYGEARRVK